LKASTAILAVALATGAAFVGFACGSATRPGKAGTLPSAGRAGDDGDGLLARVSAGGERIFGRSYGGVAYGGGMYGGGIYGGTYLGGDYEDFHGYDDLAVGGYAYGGLFYGGSLYGGTLYGNYYFDPSAVGSRQRVAPSPYSSGYYATAVADGGVIEGRVSWRKPPRRPPRLAQARSGCDSSIPNESVVTDARGNLANAVVYLADIRRGRSGIAGVSGGDARNYDYRRRHGRRLQIGGVVETHGCRFWPHVQLVAPVGAILELSNGDSVRRTVRARRWSDNSRDLIFSHTLATQGRSRSVRLDRDGFVELRSLEEGEAANAWLVVQRHPYYAITDERGRFRLDEVPPGTYELVVWHEPVVLGVDAGGRLQMSDPAIRRTKVKVRAGKATRVSVALGRQR